MAFLRSNHVGTLPSQGFESNVWGSVRGLKNLTCGLEICIQTGSLGADSGGSHVKFAKHGVSNRFRQFEDEITSRCFICPPTNLKSWILPWSLHDCVSFWSTSFRRLNVTLLHCMATKSKQPRVTEWTI